MSKRVAILGAGAAGLCMARRLSEVDGVEVDILEATDRVGGMLRSIEFDGAQFDVGTFQFFDGHGLFDTFPFLKEDFIPIAYSPESVTPHLTFDRYPFSFRQFMKDNGILVMGRAAVDLLWAKLRYRNFRNIPEFARYYLGRTIYERSGLQRYVHRLHDLADEEIDLEFARHRMTRISGQSFRTLASSGIRRLLKKLKGREIVDPFGRQRYARPAQGMQWVFDRILQDVESRGIQVLTDCPARSVSREGDKFIIATKHFTRLYDKVISTIPIPVALRLIGEKCDVPIEARTLVSLFFRGQFLRQSPVYFNFTNSAAWKRITVFSRFYGKHRDQDYFTVEATTAEASEEFVQRIRQEFERHITKFKLLESAPTYLGHFATPNAYPVYRIGQTAQVDKEKKKLDKFGIDYVGRQGNFEYIISNWVARRVQTKADSIKASLKTKEAELQNASIGQG